MFIMTVVEVRAISTTEVAVDRMVVEVDPVAATTGVAETSEEVVEVVAAVVAVVAEETTQLDMRITVVETITTPRIRKSMVTIRTLWTSFTNSELLKTTILCSSLVLTKTTATLAFTRAPSTTFSKRPVSETLQSIYDNSMRQKLANASILSRRAFSMATDMIKLKPLHWCFKSLRVLTTAMRARAWSSTSTRNQARPSRRTSEGMRRERKLRQHLNCRKRSCSTSAKNAIKEISSGSRARAEKNIEPSNLLPNSADRPRQQRIME